MPRNTSLISHPVCVSIVVPVHNEAHCVDAFWARLREIPLTESWEAIFVDDGSEDDTWLQLTRLTREADPVSAIRLSRNFGKEAAIMAGLERARGAAIVVIDGDLQHPPELIPRMVQAWLKRDVDIVDARKRSRPVSAPHDRLFSRLFYLLYRHLVGTDLRGASDFKLLDRSVIEILLGMPERTVFFRGLAAWVGFHRREVMLFDVEPRAGGHSSWSLVRRARLALDAITSYTAVPLRIVSVSGLLFVAFGAVLGLETLYIKVSGHAVDGFSTVILLLILVGGLIMLALGVIGEYLARIYDEVKARPRHIVEELTGPIAEADDSSATRPAKTRKALDRDTR